MLLAVVLSGMVPFPLHHRRGGRSSTRGRPGRSVKASSQIIAANSGGNSVLSAHQPENPALRQIRARIHSHTRRAGSSTTSAKISPKTAPRNVIAAPNSSAGRNRTTQPSAGTTSIIGGPRLTGPGRTGRADGTRLPAGGTPQNPGTRQPHPNPSPGTTPP